MSTQFTYPTVTIFVDGTAIIVPAGISIAAAIFNYHRENNKFSSGIETKVNPIENTYKPFCFMGVCFDCLVEVNGISNIQACLTTVAEGMCVRLQKNGENRD